MKPDDYNARELAAGRITASHITALTRFYQDCHGETVDGMLGPKTRESLADLYDVRSVPDPHGGATAAIAWAREQHGLWVAGPDLMVGAGDMAAHRYAMVRGYFAAEPRRTNWCAAVVAAALEAGGVPVPRKGAPRRGAQALTRWVAEHGKWVITPKQATRGPDDLAWSWATAETLCPKPGDVICWRRPPLGWRGHAALILDVWGDGSIKIAEGNVDGGQLAIRTLKADEWPRRMSGLYGVARPNYGGAR